MIANLAPSPLWGRGSGRGVTLFLLFLAACEPEPDFPADYTKSYVEVRNCRTSSEHDSHFIRILASPDAVTPYTSRDGGFPTGSIVLKEERDFGDTTCTGPILQWTVMKVQADGGVEGWHWQKVSPDRHVLTTNEPKCTACHATCGQPPDGYAGTCAVP